MPIKSQRGKTNNIWMVTREYEGLAGRGGVKDVCRQLAEALSRAGKSVTAILPLYGFMSPEEIGCSPLDATLEVDMNYAHVERREQVNFWTTKINGVNIYLVGAERYWEKKSIYTYTAEDEAEEPLHQQGTAYNDYFAMNVLLQKSTLALLVYLDEHPDIIHCHDGHTAILPAMLREIEGFRHYFRNTGTVVTIHNAGQGYHQEVGDLPFCRALCGLPASAIEDNLLDGKFDPFLAASRYAVLNTVSKNYARELKETNNDAITGWLGHRLLARGIELAGITNGINPVDFDPSQPKKMGLPAGFAPGNGEVKGKMTCKKKLLSQLNKAALKNVKQIKQFPSHTGHQDRVFQAGTLQYLPTQPLFTLVGRLTHQKGVDLLITALEKLLATDDGFQTLIMGTGEKGLENDLIRLATQKSSGGRICVLLGYEPTLANLVYAAGDFFLIPSRFEPCGLTDYIAQLAGNIPIVHHVGGLVKVRDGSTGLAFDEQTPEAIAAAMQKGLQIFRQKPEKIKAIQQKAVQVIHKQHTWDIVLKSYLKLYRAAGRMTTA